MNVELSNLPIVQDSSSSSRDERGDELGSGVHVDAHPPLTHPLPRPSAEAPLSSPRRSRRRGRAKGLLLSPSRAAVPPLPALPAPAPAPVPGTESPSSLALTRQESHRRDVPSPGRQSSAATDAERQEHSLLEQTDVPVHLSVLSSVFYGAGGAGTGARDAVSRWLSSSSSSSSPSSILSVPPVPRLTSLQPALPPKGPVGARAGASDTASASLAVGAAAPASQGRGPDETVLARGEGEARTGTDARVSEEADVDDSLSSLVASSWNAAMAMAILSRPWTSASSSPLRDYWDEDLDWRRARQSKELDREERTGVEKEERRQSWPQQPQLLRQPRVIKAAPAITESHRQDQGHDLEAHKQQYQHQRQRDDHPSSSSSRNDTSKLKLKLNPRFLIRAVFVTSMRLLVIAVLVSLFVYMVVLFVQTMRKQIDNDIKREARRE